MHLLTTATEITQTGYTTKKSSNPSIILCILWDASHELFCVFAGDYYTSAMQAAEVTESLHLIATRDCCIPGGSFFFKHQKAQKKFEPVDEISTHRGSVTFFSKMYRIFLLHIPEHRKRYLETGTNDSIHFLWTTFLVVLGFAGLPDSDQKTVRLASDSIFWQNLYCQWER